jgi:uncharacterized repeat protein (TIGR02543 family)
LLIFTLLILFTGCFITPSPGYIPPTYTVTYDGNTNTGGDVPTDANPYEQGVSVTVLAPGSLVKTGYTFGGWNTAANGSGTNQAAGSTFNMGTANVTLYAQWTANPTYTPPTYTPPTYTPSTYTVTYDGNTYTGGVVPTDANLYEQGVSVTVLAPGSLVKTGYTFGGWNTAADGLGTIQAAESSFNMGTANVTLYAQWTANPSSEKAITAFSFQGLSPVVVGTVDEGAKTIALTVPNATVVTALVATFINSAASAVTVGGTAQTSGTTANNFTNPVAYLVTAQDGTTVTYTVTVTVAPSSDATLTSTIGTVDNDAETIVAIPFVTTLADFKAGITPATGATFNVYDADGTTVATTLTSTSLVIVTAEDTTTKKTYTVTVNAELSHVATVTSGTYTVSTGGGGAETITNVPFGTTKATFEAALAKGQANQTWNDTAIADPVVSTNTLVVTAQDGTTVVTYTVTVNAAVPSVFVSAATTGKKTIVVTMDKDLTAGTYAVANGFTVSGVTPIAAVVTNVVVLNKTVTLTLDRNIKKGDTVKVSYNAATVGITKLTGADGDVASFTDQVVTNNV